MMRPAEGVRVYLCQGAVDMRKSIDGLSALVEGALGLDPFEPALYVFHNRLRDKVKVLYWEGSGFVVWYKRYEKQRVYWPAATVEGVTTMSGRELNWLLDGYDLSKLRPHRNLSFASVL
jgi:transposase